MRHFPFAISAGLVLLACSPDEQTGPQRSTSPDLALSTAQYTTVDLGTLGGTSSEAFAINPAGQVVGRSTPSASTPPRAFLWENGRMRNIGQDVGGSGSVAADINEIGQVAGTFTRTDGTTRGFVWQNGTVRRIGTLGGRNSRATGINRTGQVTGYSETSTGEVHPFLWQNGVMKDLAQLIGTQRFQYAYGISNHTHIVGGTASRPVLWTSGTARTLN